MKRPELKTIAGKRGELERKAVRMLFTPGPLGQEWEQTISRLSRRADLRPVKDRDGR